MFHEIHRLKREGFSDAWISTCKLGLSFIMTTRGIPQLYYGTEIVMEGDKSKGDGHLRYDMPDGWPGDSKTILKFSCLL